MTQNDFLEAVWLWPSVAEASKWFNWLLYAIGLGIAIWAYLRCRKCGYLLIAFSFAVFLFVAVVMPPINRVIQAHRKSDISDQDQKKMDDAIQETITRVNKDLGHPFVGDYRVAIRFPFAQLLLVAGLWFLAKGERQKTGGSGNQSTSQPPDDRHQA